MKPVDKLQPPVGPRVVVEVVPSVDPGLVRRFDRWLQKLLNEHATPREGR